MRRVLLALLGLCLLSVGLSAQAITVNALWDPNPASDNVIKYRVTVDALAPVDVPPTLNTACACIRYSFGVAVGSHTVKVTAVNLAFSPDPTSEQEGAPLTATFTLNGAAKVVNLKISK